MKFVRVPLEGAFIVELELRKDQRGFFARSFCQKEFAEHGLDPVIAQCNLSYNANRGTLRGLHYQLPQEEAKLVRCTRGAVWDVIVDIRDDSPTRYEWWAVELTDDNHRALYVPRGFAHGFQTLTDATEVLYHMSEFHHPGSALGIRWDDPALMIRWPVSDPILSDRDRAHPLLRIR
jgi:dTDP-4-dehydrorhamnose 3,5-epimerase